MFLVFDSNCYAAATHRNFVKDAVAKNPDFYVFDDSFSALDYRTDKIVRANIKNELPGTTRVIIAQRVGTSMDADQIIVLDKGKIVEEGKYEELIEKRGHFFELVERQRLEYKEK